MTTFYRGKATQDAFGPDNPFFNDDLFLTPPRPTCSFGVRGGPNFLRWGIKTQILIAIPKDSKLLRFRTTRTKVRATSNENSPIIEPIFQGVKERIANEEKQNQDPIAKEFSLYKEKTKTPEERKLTVEDICYNMTSPKTGCVNELILRDIIWTPLHVKQFVWIREQLFLTFLPLVNYKECNLTQDEVKNLKNLLIQTLPSKINKVRSSQFLFLAFICKLIPIQHPDKKILENSQKNISFNVRFLYFTSFFESNLNVLNKLLTYNRNKKQSFINYCQKVFEQPGWIKEEDKNEMASLILQNKQLVPPESSSQQVQSACKPDQTFAQNCDKEALEIKPEEVQNDNEVVQTINSSTENNSKGLVDLNSTNPLITTYNSAISPYFFSVSTFVDNVVKTIFKINDANTKTLDFFLPSQDIESLNPSNPMGLGSSIHKSSQWELKLQEFLLTGGKIQRGIIDPHWNSPLLKGLSAFFPNLKGSFRLIGTEINLNFKALSDSRLDILCVVHYESNTIIPVILENKWSCLAFSNIIQLNQYLNDFKACIFAEEGQEPLNLTLKKELENLCAGDNVEILPPVGILLVPEVSKSVLGAKEEVTRRVAAMNQNIIVLKFTLKSESNA